jgi:hypothetical protein
MLKLVSIRASEERVSLVKFADPSGKAGDVASRPSQDVESCSGLNYQPPRRALFIALWFFIIIVSVVDGYLVLHLRRDLVELNPQGQMLIALNGGQVWYLLGAKFLGTVVACAVLLLIHQRSARLGTTIAAILASLQFCLLLYLLFG